ncbi:hypothetical protein B9Q03_06260 [Candidatus Marsarchaeota G2 archaeon OSP_D]|jgi:hypothetical protein|uniref:Uncharacterized protein n=5 Tax=Candidatus Marsarchaeota group 2 TaxID=2203771 RepID=A0A2R6CCH0_9ARCH|nr:MAG: hypothetical protein B9Q03_06260 [Candidatus Marsarchaeota G2 archaeon OSP_D]PSO08541.1 MAG: hypothetical protein B9Q04_05055 [Candidatus Marsarchaeota G2 archaeon BE_D]
MIYKLNEFFNKLLFSRMQLFDKVAVWNRMVHSIKSIKTNKSVLHTKTTSVFNKAVRRAQSAVLELISMSGCALESLRRVSERYIIWLNEYLSVSILEGCHGGRTLDPFAWTRSPNLAMGYSGCAVLTGVTLNEVPCIGGDALVVRDEAGWVYGYSNTSYSSEGTL